MAAAMEGTAAVAVTQMNPTRTTDDNTALEQLLGRVVHKYFPGYGYYTGKVSEVVKDRGVVEVVYDDGDSEEMYLDQVLSVLMPADSGIPKPDVQDTKAIERFGKVWPPPAVSSRHMVNSVRARKPSSACLEQMLLEEAIKFDREQRAVEAKLKRDNAKQQAKAAAAAKAKAAKLKLAKKKAAAAAKTLKRKAAASSPANGTTGDAGKPKKRARTAGSAGSTKQKKQNGTTAAAMATGSKKASAASPKAKGKGKTAADANLKPSPPGKARKPKAKMGPVWTKCAKCLRKHWNTAECPPDLAELKLPAAATEDSPEKKRWSGRTTTGLVEVLKARRDAGLQSSSASAHSQDGTPPPNGHGAASRATTRCTRRHTKTKSSHASSCRALEDATLNDAYRIIKSKLDITCGADGRYGITGTCTKSTLKKLFDLLRSECELDGSAHFIDLGSGMGTPPMHVASLHPHVRSAVGTEFNPQLYKQSMLALKDMAEAVPCFKSDPRVFFMDANIKDLNSMHPFTHVYAFNIGMPEDTVAHMLQIIATSPSVKYAVLYPHRTTANHKRLQKLGDIVHSLSMSMPGGCSYECLVIKVKHQGQGTDVAVADPDVKNALEVLEDPLLYSEYLKQLGTVGELESEQDRTRFTRRERRLRVNKEFLSMHPCLPDINLGLLRRVALKLGVSTTGGKVSILSSIQGYVPVTFGITMFALGDDYTDDAVSHIVHTLLAVTPARRQPEANY